MSLDDGERWRSRTEGAPPLWQGEISLLRVGAGRCVAGVLSQNGGVLGADCPRQPARSLQRRAGALEDCPVETGPHHADRRRHRPRTSLALSPQAGQLIIVRCGERGP